MSMEEMKEAVSILVLLNLMERLSWLVSPDIRRLLLVIKELPILSMLGSVELLAELDSLRKFPIGIPLERCFALDASIIPRSREL
mmetsp:Transcript_16074/g.32391  ORF Transcript_16074/g.32391 Transcript_16074/m.32391 type:complete len:85 (+) Transcript_16074:2768-3022(+)